MRGGQPALALGIVFWSVVGCVSGVDAESRRADASAVAAETASRLGRGVGPPADEGDESARAAIGELLSRGLDEEAAVAVALVRSAEVRASYEDLGVARAEFVQAGLIRNPAIFANSKRFDSGTEIETAFVLPVVDAFLRPLRRRAAESGLVAQRARAVRSVVGVVFDVRREFARVRHAEGLVRVARDVLGVAESSQRLMRRLHDAGNVTGLAAAREDAAVARARLDLHAAQASLRDSRERLTERLGLWGDDANWQLAPAPSADQRPALDVTRLETRAIRASLDLAEDRAEMERAAQEAGLLSWEGVFPGADVGVTAKHEASDGWGAGPDVSIELPVFDSGAARVAGAAAALRAKLARFEALAVAIRSGARRLRDRYLSLAEREAFLRGTYVAARERVTHETLLVYNAMQIGAFEVLAARRDEFDAEREFVDTRLALELARLDLEELLAGRFRRERADAPDMASGGLGGSSAQRAGGR